MSLVGVGPVWLLYNIENKGGGRETMEEASVITQMRGDGDCLQGAAVQVGKR